MTFGPRKILQGINLTFSPGQTSVVIGPSGCGKSTVLRLVAGLLKPTRGRVWVNDRDITQLNEREMKAYRQQLGFVFQAGALFDSMTIGENVAFPISEHARVPQAELDRIVGEKLTRVNLPGLEHLYPANLSGGMQKRVSLARAIARDPGTILYDEPTTGLDPITSTVIENLIVGLTHDTQATSIVVTHQHSTIYCGDTITMLYQGQVVGSGTPAEMRASQIPLIRNFLDGIVTQELSGD
ncbi:MAG: ATP-binding cassette domain-containing protein [Candidatus Sericytochromatia bacterium]|nr:ATP-binding cassette domain-containing protein [Candidatus Sericytochromatia bacterium]